MGESRVLVVDSSPLQRMVISNVLRDGNMQVIATASNGDEALKITQSKQLDIIVTAVNMPLFDAKHLLTKIDRSKKIPVLLIAGSNDPYSLVNECMNLGAIDFIEKPDGGNFTSMNAVKDQILMKVGTALKIDMAKVVKSNNAVKSNAVTSNHSFGSKLNYDLICIGSSTGGPTAVEAVVRNLPNNTPVPIIITQHMPQRFVKVFADRLNTLTEMEVKVAEVNEKILPNTIYVAQGIGNPYIKKSINTVRLNYSNEVFPEFNNPSVNSMVESAADIYKSRLLTVILTGMGKDGTNGAEKTKKLGGKVIVQNEKTSVVYGMPKSVVDNGYADHVVSINQMGHFITSCL